jgi:hypothetical protein
MSAEASTGRRGGLPVAICVALAVTLLLAAALVFPSRTNLRLDRSAGTAATHTVLDEPTYRPPTSSAALPP